MVFCHAWPLGADSWESQMLHLPNNGFRTVAHDRRGHMRSGQPWDGNDMDHDAETHKDRGNADLLAYARGEAVGH